MEVIPTGARVGGQVDFENLTRAELGLLCLGLGLDGSFALKVGGGKPLGLGSLRLAAAELAILGAEHFILAEGQETVYKGEALGELIGEALQEAMAQGLLQVKSATDLARILAYKKTRLAPTGMY